MKKLIMISFLMMAAMCLQAESKTEKSQLPTFTYYYFNG